MNKILYKSLPEDKAPHGHKFIKGKWYKIKGKLDICKNGFHASENIIDAIRYVNCFWLAKVEVRGKSKIGSDKQCWEEMRIIDWKKWTRKDSLSLAIYSAELVSENFEKEYPNNLRPRKAIQAAKKVLENDTKKNRAAAWSAAANAAASAAASAAWSAAWSAAENAAENAEENAASAAESASKEKMHNWIIKRKKL